MSNKLTSIDLMFLATSILRSNNSTKEQVFLAKKLFRELCEEELSLKDNVSGNSKASNEQILKRIALEEERIKELKNLEDSKESKSLTVDFNLSPMFETGSFSISQYDEQYPKNWAPRRKQPPAPVMPKFGRKHRG